MATLQKQLERAKTLSRGELVKAIFSFIRKVEAELTALNREQLNKQSTDVMGEALGFYTRATEYITTNDALLGKKVRIKRAGDPYDLLQEGNFLDSLFLKIVDEVVIFGSSDPKLDAILDNPQLEGKQLFGLTDENLKSVIQTMILPFYKKSVRMKLKI